jgi:hypothetical protein
MQNLKLWVYDKLHKINNYMLKDCLMHMLDQMEFDIILQKK